MPFDVAWYDDQHSIIEVRVYGSPTWEEYHSAIDKVVKDLAAAQSRVDIIFNSASGMPKGNPLPHLKATFKKFSEYPNFGITVASGARGPAGFTRAIVEIVSKMLGLTSHINGHFVNSMPEAVAYIQADRAKAEMAEKIPA